MWHVPSQGHRKSPIDHFNNDETLEKLLDRAIKFWPDRKCWSHYSIRNLFRVYAGGRVSNFRPTAASFIINRYSSKKDTVLDFCAGFGGRLLGALAMDRKYLGIDASHQQVLGLNKMSKALNRHSKGQAELVHGAAEEILPSLRSRSFNLIFTSPPYFDLEKYNKSKNQSFVRYKNYEEWKIGFLSAVVKESHRLLKKNGRLVINIANTSTYPIASDFNKIAIEHFDPSEKLKMLMNARPLQRVNGQVYRYEPVFVYKKN
jgi:DNA modification methylase